MGAPINVQNADFLFNYAFFLNADGFYDNLANYNGIDFNIDSIAETLDSSIKFGKKLSNINQGFDPNFNNDNKIKKTILPPEVHQVYQEFLQNCFNNLDAPEQFGGLNLPTIMYSAINEIFMGDNISFAMYSGLTHGAYNLLLEFTKPNLDKIDDYSLKDEEKTSDDFYNNFIRSTYVAPMIVVPQLVLCA